MMRNHFHVKVSELKVIIDNCNTKSIKLWRDGNQEYLINCSNDACISLVKFKNFHGSLGDFVFLKSQSGVKKFIFSVEKLSSGEMKGAC